MRWVKGRSSVVLLIGAAVLSAAVVAVVSFTGSYQHQYELDIRYGQAHWVAGMQPISVEGLIAAATLMLWFSAMIGKRRRDVWPAYLVLAAGVGQAALMNLGADRHYNWPWLGPEISIWPAVAFFAAYEMAVWMVRNRPQSPQTEDDTPEVVIPETTEPVRGVVPFDLVLPHPPVVTVNDSAPSGVIVANGSERTLHTCNDGNGPKGGVKTPGCPRCDELLAGATPRGGRRR